MAKKPRAPSPPQIVDLPVCFVIMPIAESDTRPTEHFRKVYNQIFKPACEKAGYQAVRADDIRQTNVIHIEILNRILKSPMTLCDLSGLNPNVMFELGIRQAFDKPVVLVQEKGTKSVFDIGTLRYTEYRKERIYDELVDDIDNISQALIATRDAPAGENVNSIIRLLSVANAANIPTSDESPTTAMLELIRGEIGALRDQVSKTAARNPDSNAISKAAQRITAIFGIPPIESLPLIHYLHMSGVFVTLDDAVIFLSKGPEAEIRSVLGSHVRTYLDNKRRN